MSKTPNPSVIALLAIALPIVASAGGGSVDRNVMADPKGDVIISNVSGKVDVRGWDKNLVQVTGHLDEGVERLDLENSSGRTTVKVVLPRGSSREGDAEIEVWVPKASTVEVTAVSADVSSRDVLGTQRLKTVSGEVTADVVGDDSEVRSVSGDLTVRGGGQPVSLRVSSVSGNLDLTNAAGTLELVTVSGDSHITMGDTSEIRARTTSGDMQIHARLTSDARVDAEGVSGDITLKLASQGGFSTEIESFSGDIHGCLATSVERVSKYGPGTRLNIRSTASSARVRAKTLSGDIDICDR